MARHRRRDRPAPGGIYRVLVGGQHQSAGEYVEVVPNEKVVFTFGWEEKDHPIPPGSTTVEITLHPEGDKTRVRLVHRGLPADAVEDHGHGWAHYLERLAIAATGGDPGPRRDARAPADRCRIPRRRGWRLTRRRNDVDTREESAMNTPPIVSPEEWEAARRATAREGEGADPRP